MFSNVALPLKGFAGPIRILQLDVAVGQRGEHDTELFVRGVCACGGIATPFAGCTVLAQDGGGPDHDLALVMERMDDGFADELAVSVHLALDAHASELMEAEMDRFCS